MEAGHNSGLTEAQFHEHLAMISKAEADLDLARARKNAARKKAKAAGISLGDLDAMRKVAELTRSEQIEKLNAQAQYLTWLKVPIGSQMSLFPSGDDDPFGKGDNTEKDALADAEKQGFLDGISGRDEDCPFEKNGSIGMAWIKGYRAGREKFDNAPDPMAEDDDDDLGGDEGDGEEAA